MANLNTFISKNLGRVKRVLRSAADRLTFMVSPARKISLDNGGKKVIVFLGPDLQARIPRLSKWIRRRGDYYTILLVEEGKGYQHFNPTEFDFQMTYTSKWELIRIVRGLGDQPWRYHGYGPPFVYLRACMENTSVPVFVDVQDLYVTNYGLNPPILYMKIDLKNEAYCLKNAAGIISQSIEANLGLHLYEIKPKPPTLFFPIYCDEDFMVKRTREFDLEDIHIVYPGSIYGSDSDPGQFGNMIYFELIKKMEANRIHFHIYPSPQVKDHVFKEYKAIADKSEYFHLHPTVSQDRLTEEIAKYDYGILPFFNSGTNRSIEKRRRGTSLKVFKFLEAGLGVIVATDAEFHCWIARRAGRGIGIQEQGIIDLRKVIEEAGGVPNDDSKLKGFGLNENLDRLLDFYDVAEEK